MKVKGNRARWLTNVTMFTLAGMVTSSIVGVLTVLAGRLILPDEFASPAAIVGIFVALLVIVREFEWAPIPLPQLKRQTEGAWARRFGFGSTVSATLWGLDLGLIFSHWLTFSGVWLIFVIALVMGDLAFGMALFIAYWLGKALPVWIAPLLMKEDTTVPQLMDEVVEHTRLFRKVHVLGAVSSIAVFITLLW